MLRRTTWLVAHTILLAVAAFPASAADKAVSGGGDGQVPEKVAPVLTIKEKQLNSLLKYREPAAPPEAIGPQSIFVTGDKHTWLFRPVVWQLVFGKEQELWFHCEGWFRQSGDWDIQVVVSASQPGDWVKLVDLHRAVMTAGNSWLISLAHANLDVDKDRKSVLIRVDLSSGDQTATFTTPNNIEGLTF